jgi:hypothetical protein
METTMLDKDKFFAICDAAHEAGIKAVSDLAVVPMLVGQETSLFSGKIDYTKPVEYIADGVCGFAWVSVKPEHKGNTRLGKDERIVLEAAGFSKNDYEKTYQLWISLFNQSMQKKEKYAAEYAKVLRANGIRAYSGSRMD